MKNPTLGAVAVLALLVFGVARCGGSSSASEQASPEVSASVAASVAASASAAAAEEAAEKAEKAKEAADEKKQEQEDAKEAAAEEAAEKKARNKIVTMPNLVGLNLKIAYYAAENAGLQNASVCRTPGGEIPIIKSHWRVLTQSVRPGKRIKGGAKICLGAMKDSDM